MKNWLFVILVLCSFSTPEDKQAPVWESMSYYDVVDQDFRSLHELMGVNGLALVFIGSNCPYVEKYQERIVHLHQQAKDYGVKLALVNSNSSIGNNIESIEQMRATAIQLGITYISDQSQKVSEAFEVTRNPEIVILSSKNHFPKVYQGKIDSSPLQETQHTLNYAIPVMEQLENGLVPEFTFQKSVGCAIR